MEWISQYLIITQRLTFSESHFMSDESHWENTSYGFVRKADFELEHLYPERKLTLYYNGCLVYHNYDDGDLCPDQVIIHLNKETYESFLKENIFEDENSILISMNNFIYEKSKTFLVELFESLRIKDPQALCDEFELFVLFKIQEFI